MLHAAIASALPIERRDVPSTSQTAPSLVRPSRRSAGSGAATS